MIEWDTLFKKNIKLNRSFPTGTKLFTGAQGAGKTLSATHYLVKLKKQYPDLIIYSNIKFSLADEVLTPDQITERILTKDKDDRPVAFLLDEIQTLLYRKAGKSISFEVFRAICQQRKARKTIIGTLQEILDLDITYRRQLDSAILCSRIGSFQIERWRDPQKLKYDAKKNDYVSPTVRWNIWKRHKAAYDVYDTLEIVNATMDLDHQSQTNTRLANSTRLSYNFSRKEGK